MANSVDFILPSCYGLPEAIWIAASAMLDTILTKCWALLGAFLVIKLLVSAWGDVGEERFSLRTYLKILFQGLLIALFLTYYKTFLMTFDYFIDSICVFDSDVFQPTKELKEPSGSAWFGFLKSPIQTLLDNWAQWLVLFTHGGAVKLMHYVKSVTLLVLLQFGPLAALFSLLPGPFKQSFSTWSKSYLNVSCWTITLNILWVLSNSFSRVAIETAGNPSSLLGEKMAYTMLSLVLFIAIFLTPTWTSKLINGVNPANLTAGIGMVAEKIVGMAKKPKQ